MHLDQFLYVVSLDSEHPAQDRPPAVSLFTEREPKLTWVTFCKCLRLAVPGILVCKMGLSASAAHALYPP